MQCYVMPGTGVYVGFFLAGLLRLESKIVAMEELTLSRLYDRHNKLTCGLQLSAQHSTTEWNSSRYRLFGSMDFLTLSFGVDHNDAFKKLP